MKLAAALSVLLLTSPAFARDRWTPAEANDWYAHQPRLIGSNYVPANAINQLEMWQADSFDPVRIGRELGGRRRSG